MFTELLEQIGLALNAAGIPYMLLLSSSPYEQQALQRASVVTIGRAELRFAAMEDLIIHKVIAGRPRDLEDVRTVLLKNPNVDVVYIRMGDMLPSGWRLDSLHQNIDNHVEKQDDERCVLKLNNRAMLTNLLTRWRGRFVPNRVGVELVSGGLYGTSV